MRNFVVFTYQFSPIFDESQLLFDDYQVDPQQSMTQKNTLFDKVINDESLILSYRNTRFRRLILQSQDGICVFRLANKKYLRVEEDFHSNRINNYPSVLVIVDNREDKQRILIEDRTDAFHNEGYVARILQSSFRNSLLCHKLSITISKEYQSSEFWKLISDNEKSIEKVRFAFPYPNLSRIKDSIKDVIADINKSTNSKDTKFELNAASGEYLTIKPNDNSIVGLVDASAGSGQGIFIKLKGIRHQQEVGKTKRVVSIDEIDSVIPEVAYLRIIKMLNNL